MDLSPLYNNEFSITDLSPLSNLPYLLILNASHNKLTTILDFKPPLNLKEVDLSFNEISAMVDLSAHHYLMKLNLDSILCLYTLLRVLGI